MQVHGVGAGPRGFNAGPPQAPANRPQRSEASPPAGGTDIVTPSSGHHPPAHGVRRLLEAGHFEGSGAYSAHVARLGVPAYALAAETPVDEIPTDEALVEDLVVEEPGEAVLDAPVDTVLDEPVDTILDDLVENIVEPADGVVVEEPPAEDPALLDLDALLMEELIAEQEAPPTLLEQIVETIEDDTTVLEEIVESIEEDAV